MKVRTFIALTLVGPLMGGCAVGTHVDPVTSAAAEVASGKVFSSPVLIDYAFQPSELDVTVEVTGYAGSACSFPLALSQAFYATFAAINQQAFRNLAAPNTPNSYRVRFQLNSFDNSLVFASGFFHATAVAHSDLTLRVSVTAPDGSEISRQLIRGSGQQRTDVGSCPGGSEAVSAAVKKALQQVAEDYAYRIINPLTIP